MKKLNTIYFGLLWVLLSSFLIVSCNDDEVPPEALEPLIADPTSLVVPTGTTGLAVISGGLTPYTILTPPDAAIATAEIASIGILEITPVAAGTTSITVRDNSDPPRSVSLPIVVTIGHGDIGFSWTINNQTPSTMCGQVNSTAVRVTVDGYAPVTYPCGDGSLTIDSITAGNHTITAQLLSPTSTVLATVTQSVFVSAEDPTNVFVNFNAPLIIGSLHVSWTINGQPAGSGCGNAVSVRSALGSLSPINELCSTGQYTLNNIPEGPYTLVSDLLDISNATLSHIVNSVTIRANQTTNVNINFTTGPVMGSATVSWTINGGTNCTPNGAISITASGPSAGIHNSSCDTYSRQITNLGPGTYNFDVVLTDPNFPGQQATAQAQNVVVTANSNSFVSLDINCMFCSGTSSTGWVQVNVECGGMACGLTGTLYVMIKDCGTGNAILHSDNLPGTTLSGSGSVSHTLNNVLSGGRCLVVFLDTDGNGVISSGDAVSSLGEQNVLILGGETATVDVMLDSVNP